MKTKRSKAPPRRTQLDEREWRRAEMKGAADRVAELDAQFNNERALDALATFRRSLKRSGF